MYKNLLLALSLFSTAAYAQDVDWIKQTGSPGGTIIASSTVVDAGGNYITRGSFSGTVDFNPGSGVFNLSAQGASDAFVQKLDAQGNFLWAVRIGNTGRDRAMAVATDASNSIYVLGQFIGTVDMNPGTGIFNLISSTASTENCFVLKLTSAGAFSWARREVPMLGSDVTMNEQGSIRTDNSGFVYACYSYNNMFYQHISRYSTSAGSLFWQRQLKGNVSVGLDKINNAAMQVDGTGNVYVAGMFEGTVDLNPSATFSGFTTSNYRNGFVVKLNNAGIYQWSQQLTSDYILGVNAITLDRSNNILLGGNFSGTADFDPSSNVVSESSDPTNSYTQGMYLLQLSNSGAYNWVKAYQASGMSNADLTSITVSPTTGAIYMGGTFTEKLDFNPKGFFPAYVQGYGFRDAFISKLSNTGNFVWVKQLGGNDFESAPEVFPVANGEAIVSGVFNSIFTVDAGSTNGGTQLAPIGLRDAYLVKIGSCGTLSSKISKAGMDITAEEANATSYGWIDCHTNAPIDGANKQTFTPKQNGSYAVVITQGGCSVTSECIVVEGLKVDGNLSANTINVYPNPTSGAVRLELSKEYKDVTIEVRSAVGQLVAQKTNISGQSFDLDINGAPGTYFITVKAENAQAQLRVIKQ
ncbi:MAG: T9SS type A sorting domain-containing protein [Sphingobacteriales bacterium]|nr:MAG: T9SS type A sorting domain-containing protein [Sphingobacteriales bacterium]